MFGCIIDQIKLQYFIIQIVDDGNFTIRNNKLSKNVTVESLLDFIWHHHSDLSLGIDGYGLDYELGLCVRTCEKG